MKTHCAAAVFSVKDLDASLAHYRDVLGFKEDFRFGSYAGLACGEVLIHLTQDHPIVRQPGAGAVYIFCDEVDSYYQEIVRKGARTRTAPQDWPYGMRDFMAFDPDGNKLTFGCECRPS